MQVLPSSNWFSFGKLHSLIFKIDIQNIQVESNRLKTSQQKWWSISDSSSKQQLDESQFKFRNWLSYELDIC